MPDRLPRRPPPLQELLERCGGLQETLPLLSRLASTAAEAVTTRTSRDRYLLSSLMEEAITSSQMEGAATTRDVAKAMIRSRRPPRDRSERMILNTFLTMQRIRELRKQPPTPQLVLDLHRLVSQDTLDDPAGKEVVEDDLYGTRVSCAAAGGRAAAAAGGALPVCERRDPAGVHPPGAAGHHPALLAGLRPPLCDDNDLTYVLLAQVKVILQALASLHS